jgi:hypothetical protein
MVDHNIYVGEINKLEGNLNYQTWKIKARTIYKWKNIWEVVCTKINIATFLVIVNGAQIIENQLKLMRNKTMFIFVPLVKLDDLLETMTQIDDPYNGWETLKIMF